MIRLTTSNWKYDLSPEQITPLSVNKDRHPPELEVRSDCPGCIDALILPRYGFWVILARQGTVTINDQPILKIGFLKHGDAIRIGHSEPLFFERT